MNSCVFLVLFPCKLCKGDRSGVWVYGGDNVIIPCEGGSLSDLRIEWMDPCDALVVSVASSLSYASGHGAILETDGHLVSNIHYQASIDFLEMVFQGKDEVPVIAGLAYLSPGLVSLFFDILGVMAVDVTPADFCSGGFAQRYDSVQKSLVLPSEKFRKALWEELHKYKLRNATMIGRHFYISDRLPFQEFLPMLRHGPSVHSFFQDSSIPDKVVCVNSLIDCPVMVDGDAEQKPVIQHCHLSGSQPISLGPDTFLYNVHLNTDACGEVKVPSGWMLLSYPCIPSSGNSMILITFPMNESLQLTSTHETGLMWTWEDDKQKVLEFLNHLCKGNSSKTREMILKMQNCISQLKFIVDSDALRGCQQNLAVKILKVSLSRLHQPRDIPLPIYLRAAASEGWGESLLDVLDNVTKKSESESKAAAFLAATAELIGCIAGNFGGLRSGPASNPAWKHALLSLEERGVGAGVDALTTVRKEWWRSPSWLHPHQLVRIARHYDMAAQILIRKTTASARNFMRVKEGGEMVPYDIPVTAACPARADLQGGWTDTPPICYELGGSVIILSITVDGKKPIGCRGERKSEPVIRVRTGDSNEAVMVASWADMEDYANPVASGALVKAGLVSSRILDPKHGDSLKDQLLSRYGGGFEVELHSTLPHGSGLGTSSILAAAMLAVLWTLIGTQFSKRDLIHAVLELEQVSTTGGGWQDTVGGVMGGLSHAQSSRGTQVEVLRRFVSPPSGFMDVFFRHLVLLYTGKVRLAKNLLQVHQLFLIPVSHHQRRGFVISNSLHFQTVIRQWYAGEEEVVNCLKVMLTDTSIRARKAFERGDLEEVGACIDRYWEQKKVIARGCEPELVRQVMDAFRPHVYGQTLVGAGGGGYMIAVTKMPDARATLEDLVQKIPGGAKVRFCTAGSDETGLELKVGSTSLELAEL
ncbi:unnamed protein product [Darwinula stevensoni]|uniref:Fucokinase n=1 Tax=Darwinula stevensoni TaxID=69355 RepID=A0A7R9FPQ5_9CRUS|nr:unnamed protein product [Darwinula stevensoni]CAG0898266.1 unnamed protein product [Darwinula stevensoni]